MSTTGAQRADAPIAKLDFTNGQGAARLDSTQPQPRNHALAQRGPIGIGDDVLVNSRDLVMDALMKPEVYSSADLIEQGNTRPLIPLGIDPPDHARYRRILNPLFAERRMKVQETDIAARVNRFIDSFIDRGSCDFTAEFAELFPSSVFLGLMGLRWDELDILVRLRDGLLHPGTPESTPHERNEIQRRTAQEVYTYFGAVLDERTDAENETDILSHLASLESGDGGLSRDEALSICFVLLTAGLDTVTDSLTCFWAYLAQHDRQRREIAENPEVIPLAVEELLRWETPVPLVARWAREDSRLGDRAVAAGRHVMVNLSAANLDPAIFSDPLEVRFDRRDNRRHVAFGGGIHHCLGSQLARRELRIALREWHRRIPEYALAPGYEVRYRPPLRFVPDLQLSWPGRGRR